MKAYRRICDPRLRRAVSDETKMACLESDAVRGAKGSPEFDSQLPDNRDRQSRYDDGFQTAFLIDGFRRHCLMHGLDEIGLTLQNEEKMARFEERSVNFLGFS